MALSIGDVNAAAGMSQEIYSQLNELLSPPLQEAVNNASEAAQPAAQDALEGARESWKKLAFAVATGVINHIVQNIEIHNVQTGGTVIISIAGNSGPAEPASHIHEVALSGTASNVVFEQNNSGVGLVR